jgi:hypothetical protein
MARIPVLLRLRQSYPEINGQLEKDGTKKASVARYLSGAAV